MDRGASSREVLPNDFMLQRIAKGYVLRERFVLPPLDDLSASLHRGEPIPVKIRKEEYELDVTVCASRYR